MVCDDSEHEKAKGFNKYVVGAIGQNEYKGVLLNKNYLKHLINRIQSKSQIRWTLSWFGEKIYI